MSYPLVRTPLVLWHTEHLLQHPFKFCTPPPTPDMLSRTLMDPSGPVLCLLRVASSVLCVNNIPPCLVRGQQYSVRGNTQDLICCLDPTTSLCGFELSLEFSVWFLFIEVKIKSALPPSVYY